MGHASSSPFIGTFQFVKSSSAISSTTLSPYRELIETINRDFNHEIPVVLFTACFILASNTLLGTFRTEYLVSILDSY